MNTMVAVVALLLLSLQLPLPSNQVPSEWLLQQLLENEPPIRALPLSSSSPMSTQQQQQHPDAPKLIPLSALERYQEGAELKLFCAASSPQSAGRLHFEWRKNQVEQLASNLQQQQQQQSKGQLGRHVHISMMDDSSSLLRISQLEADDSGNYTCLARNQHGSDSSTVRVNISVRLKWIKEPPSELQVRAGKAVHLECDASGQPSPLISWTSLKDQQSINSKVLRIERAQVNDSGLYECRAVASSGHNLRQHYLLPMEQESPNSGEHLRKLVRLTVNGK